MANQSKKKKKKKKKSLRITPSAARLWRDNRGSARSSYTWTTVLCFCFFVLFFRCCFLCVRDPIDKVALIFPILCSRQPSGPVTISTSSAKSLTLPPMTDKCSGLIASISLPVSGIHFKLDGVDTDAIIVLTERRGRIDLALLCAAIEY